MTPTSGPFRMLCGAAIAYGLTSGGYNANQIAVEPLAKRILRPLEDGDDLNAKREAFLRPRIINEFLNKYNGHALPSLVIGHNVLNSMGVPIDRTEDVLKLILEGAESVGFITTIKDKKYVQLTGAVASKEPPVRNVEVFTSNGSPIVEDVPVSSQILEYPNPPVANTHLDTKKNNKVFITHGKNKNLVEPIKQLLVFGKFEPVVSVERQATSKPVPDKVMDDMRSCGAAIIHVESEMQLLDSAGSTHNVLNPNVLIEIGAAMALYGKRFILLVKNGVKLPSNLQGLYEVRYEEENLTANDTIALLKAINAMSNE